MFNCIRELVEEKNNKCKLPSQKWADMLATTLANKNREILNDMLSRLGELQNKNSSANEYKYWRNVFAAAAIQNGLSCEQSIMIADEMLARLGISKQEDN